MSSVVLSLHLDDKLYETLKFHQNAVGGVPGPFDAWLVLRGREDPWLCAWKRTRKMPWKLLVILEKHPAVEKGDVSWFAQSPSA
jgi:cystathionine beta-lyase/cystathionine gamma-synthase